MANYKFLREWEDVKVGDVLSEEQLLERGLALKDIDAGVEDKTLELVPAEATTESLAVQEQHDAEVRAAEEAEAAAVVADEAVDPQMVYLGKQVLYSGTRLVNDKEYHHIRTADGASYDLTEEEYQAAISAK